MRSDSGQQVHGLVPDPIFRNHAAPVGYVRIVAERQHPGICNFGRQ